jgi:hypothetical protein
VAEILAVHRHTVRAWLAAYEKGGLDTLLTLKQAPGKHSALPPPCAPATDAVTPAPRFWELRRDSAVLGDRAPRSPCLQYRARSRPLSAPGQTQDSAPLASEKNLDAVAQFHTPLSSQLLTAVHAAHQQGYPGCRMWAQDESRCGLLPIVRRRITALGIQPVLSSAYRFESLYLYGAVAPLTGVSFFLELPALNTAAFQPFLDHFAAIDPTSFHLLLLDNGAFHKALRFPPNVGLLFFPPILLS